MHTANDFKLSQALFLNLLLLLLLLIPGSRIHGNLLVAVFAVPLFAYLLSSAVYFLFLANSSPRKFFQPSSLPPKKLLFRTLVYFAAYIPVSVVHYISVRLLPPPDTYFMLQDQLLQIGIVPAMLGLAILPALLEELFFRGILCIGLSPSFQSKGPAVFISSLLFAVSHMNVWQFTPALLLGLILGWIAVSSRSIRLPVLLHLASNSIAVLLAYLPEFASI